MEIRSDGHRPAPGLPGPKGARCRNTTAADDLENRHQFSRGTSRAPSGSGVRSFPSEGERGRDLQAGCFASSTSAIQAPACASKLTRYGSQPRSRSRSAIRTGFSVDGALKPALTLAPAVSINTGNPPTRIFRSAPRDQLQARTVAAPERYSRPSRTANCGMPKTARSFGARLQARWIGICSMSCVMP